MGMRATGYQFPAFLFSCAVLVLRVKIHINMHNMQNMSNIKFLSFMQDIADKCNSRSIWDTKFDACSRTICQNRVNAATGHCARL